MVAGVFSRCKFHTTSSTPDGSDTPLSCCLDPVVYERISEEMKSWIWSHAPGVRDTQGCPRKLVKCKWHYYLIINRSYLFIAATPRARVAGCRCGVESRYSGSNRIIGGEKLGRDEVCGR